MTYKILYVLATWSDIARLTPEARAALDTLLEQLTKDPYQDTQPDPRSPRLRHARTPDGLHVLLSVNGERPPFLKPGAFWEPTLTVVELDEIPK